jgi:hypothetical protein
MAVLLTSYGEGSKRHSTAGIVAARGSHLAARKGVIMPRGSKTKYSTKQKREAQHIEEGAKQRGYSTARATQTGWATANKQERGGKKGGRGKTGNKSSSRASGRRSQRG